MTKTGKPILPLVTKEHQLEFFGGTEHGKTDPGDCDEFYGLLCEARRGKQGLDLPMGEIEVKKKEDTNRQLVEDYSYWFWNYR